MQSPMPDWIKIKKLKKVLTRDVNGRDNGFLVDILNRNDALFADRETELFQQVYYSTVYANMFKGFHIHPFKYDTVTCLFGKALLVFYPHLVPKDQVNEKINVDDLVVVELDTEESLQVVSFPSKYPHGYFGVSEISYILNYRNPAWHPADTHQYDMKLEGIEDYLKQWVRIHADR